MRVRFERHGNGFVARYGPLGSALRTLGILCALSPACSKREALPQRPPPTRGIGPVRPATTVAPTAPNDMPVLPPRLLAADEIPSAAPAAQDKPTEDKPPRDFSAELLQLLGSPAGCLNARTSDNAPASIDISVSTSVMPSGSVAQAEVHGAGLETSELQCLRARLESLHFGQPIENAPFSVRGTLHLTRATAITPGQPAKGAQTERQREPTTAIEPAAAPNELTNGNPEVGAPPLNAADPP